MASVMHITPQKKKKQGNAHLAFFASYYHKTQVKHAASFFAFAPSPHTQKPKFLLFYDCYLPSFFLTFFFKGLLVEY
jgi:hypothetical protein